AKCLAGLFEVAVGGVVIVILFLPRDEAGHAEGGQACLEVGEVRHGIFLLNLEHGAAPCARDRRRPLESSYGAVRGTGTEMQSQQRAARRQSAATTEPVRSALRWR